MSFVLIIVVVCFFYHLSGKIAVFFVFRKYLKFIQIFADFASRSLPLLLTRKTILIFKIVFLNYLFVYSLFDFQ